MHESETQADSLEGCRSVGHDDARCVGSVDTLEPGCCFAISVHERALYPLLPASANAKSIFPKSTIESREQKIIDVGMWTVHYVLVEWDKNVHFSAKVACMWGCLCR